MIKLLSTPRGQNDKPPTFTANTTLNITTSSVPRKDTSATSSKEGGTQEFAFINSTAPGRHRDPEIRRLVRGHVVRDFSRKKKLQQRQPSSGFFQSQQTSGESSDAIDTLSNSLSPKQKEETLAISQKYPSPTQGLDPKPHISNDLYRINALGETMYPLTSSFRFNPISPAAWFDCALKDQALFHALLYITCTYSNLLPGPNKSKLDEDHEAMAHAGRSISLVKRKLDDIILGWKKPDFGDVENIVRTVSCLAITEAIKGNKEGWKIHMRGLKQLVALKGGLVVFETMVQLKLHRTDLLGAVDFIEEPFFATENLLISIPSRYELGNEGEGEEMRVLLNTLPVGEELHDILAYMHVLSTVVSRILGGRTVCSGSQQVSWQKHAYALRYALLGGLGKCDSLDEERRVLNEALRIGALLYVQATPPEFPYSVVGPTNLVARLKQFVLTIQIWNEREGNLVMWLLFMGGISARKGDDKVWFVTQLEKLSARLRLCDWEVVKRRLASLWWVEGIHEKPCRKLWEEVVALRTMEVINTASQFST